MPPSTQRAKVLADYSAADVDELSFNLGQVVNVTRTGRPDDWWRGFIEGDSPKQQGLFPGSFVALDSEFASRGGAIGEDKFVKVEKGEDAVPMQGASLLQLDHFGRAPTKYGVCASNCAQYAAMALTLFGGAGILSFFEGTPRQESIEAITGAYAAIFAVLIVLYERTAGQTRTTASVLPFEGLVYLLGSFFLFWGRYTQFAAPATIGVSLLYFMSNMKKETWNEKQMQRKRSAEAEEYGNISVWLNKQKYEGNIGHIAFLVVYLAANALAAYTHFVANTGPGLLILVGFAKLFGNLLNLNCSFIALPVARTIIRAVYNRSTSKDGSCTTMFFQAVTKFFPVDNNIAFHKLVAILIGISTIGHMIAHLTAWALLRDFWETTYGEWTLISGTIIFLAQVFMYGAARKNIRIKQFELFFSIHHLFFVFWLFLILHGVPGIGPNFWKWFLAPGLFYGLEVFLRFTRARRNLYVVAVQYMEPDVINLAFKQPFGKAGHKEGQYVFIKCPSVSTVEWHPFTISSAPDDEYLTLHIRVQGPGSWTRRMKEYLDLMGNGRARFELFRIEDAKRVPGKSQGPDGNAIIQIDGPHSAPTQFCVDYNTVMLVSAGIGITPAAATMRSFLKYKWRFGYKPHNLYFYWIVSHKDVPAWKWFVHQLKDYADRMTHLKATSDQNNSFGMNVFVTSVKDKMHPTTIEPPAAFGILSTQVENTAAFTYGDIYAAMAAPKDKNGLTTFGDYLNIYTGRPKWNDHFQKVARDHQQGDVGVTFCGPGGIGQQLNRSCDELTTKARKFKLHTEVF